MEQIQRLWMDQTKRLQVTMKYVFSHISLKLFFPTCHYFCLENAVSCANKQQLFTTNRQTDKYAERIDQSVWLDDEVYGIRVSTTNWLLFVVETFLSRVIGVNLYTFGVALGPPPQCWVRPPQWCYRPPQSLKGARVWNGLDQSAGLIIQSNP